MFMFLTVHVHNNEENNNNKLSQVRVIWTVYMEYKNSTVSLISAVLTNNRQYISTVLNGGGGGEVHLYA